MQAVGRCGVAATVAERATRHMPTTTAVYARKVGKSQFAGVGWGLLYAAMISLHCAIHSPHAYSTPLGATFHMAVSPNGW